MKHTAKMASGCMIYKLHFMAIGIGVQAILRFCLNNLSFCNVDITDGIYEVFHLGGLRWHNIHTYQVS
jgi:hypothetical protein